MTSLAYYNENDKKAAAWLRELISNGLIAPGDVDTRSIVDVKADEIYGYGQHHFFAGIGGWSASLRLAGWPDGKPVCTASCPCQPFSGCGKGEGTKDARHLWPYVAKLVAKLRPAVIFGEQVASPAGRLWLAGVRANLEVMGYGVGAADLCAPSTGKTRQFQVGEAIRTVVRYARGDDASERFGQWWRDAGLYARFDCEQPAPHIRQRLVWVAESEDGRRNRRAGTRRFAANEGGGRSEPGDSGRVGNANGDGTGRDAGTILETKTGTEGFGNVDRGIADVAFNAGDTSKRVGNAASDDERRARERESIGSGEAGRSSADSASGLPNANHDAGSAEQLNSSGERSAPGTAHDAVPRGSGGDVDGSDDGVSDTASEGRERTARGRATSGRERAGSLSQRGDAKRRFTEHCGHGRRYRRTYAVGLGLAGVEGSQRHTGDEDRGEESGRLSQVAGGSVTASGCRVAAWEGAEWVACKDGKARRLEPGIIPLVDGFPARVACVRGAGNAIVPPMIAEFILAYREIQEDV